MSPRYDIGFLGGGQLARMSIQAAQRMGLRCLSLDPGDDTPASQIAPAIVGNLSDVDKIAEVFRRCRRVTLENEFIRASDIEQGCILAGRSATDLVPTITSLATIQDKLDQRRALLRAGVPSPLAVELGIDPSDAIRQIGFPMMIKSRFGGYDGKGAKAVHSLTELMDCSGLWSRGDWLAEQFVPFERELAVMAYVDSDRAGCFPTMESVQVDHVCDLVFPANLDASEIALAAVRAVDGAGLYGVELFELRDGSLQVNELAPRPHNTGHYTLDWGGVSQFEQHIRLVMGWTLVEPAGGESCMANLLGQPNAGPYLDAVPSALQVPRTFFHWYGKAQSKPGRKMGHINAVGVDCVERAIEARRRFYSAWTR